MRLRAATSTSLLLTQRHEHLKRAGPPRPPRLRVCDRDPSKCASVLSVDDHRRRGGRDVHTRGTVELGLPPEFFRRPPGCAPGCPAQAAAAARAKSSSPAPLRPAAGDREGFAELLLELAEELRAQIRSERVDGSRMCGPRSSPSPAHVPRSYRRRARLLAGQSSVLRSLDPAQCAFECCSGSRVTDTPLDPGAVPGASVRKHPGRVPDLGHQHDLPARCGAFEHRGVRGERVFHGGDGALRGANGNRRRYRRAAKVVPARHRHALRLDLAVRVAVADRGAVLGDGPWSPC